MRDERRERRDEPPAPAGRSCRSRRRPVRSRSARDSRRRSACAPVRPGRSHHGSLMDGSAKSASEELYEAKRRAAAARAVADLDLVRDRADDRDPETPSVSSASASFADSSSSKPAPSSETSITSRSRRSSNEISTCPSPVRIRVSDGVGARLARASLRSAIVASDRGRTRERPERASRDSVMYSGLAGWSGERCDCSPTGLSDSR